MDKLRPFVELLENHIILRMVVYAFVFIYFLRIFKDIHQILKIKKCLHKLKKFISAFKFRKNSILYGNSDYIKELKSLIKFYPEIYQHFSSPSIDRNFNDYTNFENSQFLYSKFLKEKDFKIYDLKYSLNPWNTVKLILSFPSTLLLKNGVSPRKRSNILVNIIVWTITFSIEHFFDLFSEEIKALLVSMWEYLSHI